MKKLISLFCQIALFVIFPVCAFAIPGVNHFLRDYPGEFIYYEDFSFSRKSYIGFLTYDEETFAARYFAPPTQDLPQKNVELLFTIDSSKDYIEMTGERFVTQITQEDTDIINYLHDLIYEFSSRRKKAGTISPEVKIDNSLNQQVKYVSATNFLDSGFIKREDFSQFGGDVFVYYDYLAPIFNIKKITDNAGKNLFEAIASGKLSSSNDKSFSEFYPIIETRKKSDLKSIKKNPKKTVIEIEKSTLTLDENWKNAGEYENLFFYGDALAFLQVGVINSSDIYAHQKMAILSSKEKFCPWNKISFIEEKNQITIYSTAFLENDSHRAITSFLLKNKNLSSTENAALSLVVPLDEYFNKQKYFSQVLKSWE